MHSGRWMSIFSHIYFFHWLTAELWAFQLPFFLKFSTRTFIFSPFVFHRNLDFFPKKILVEMKKIANHPPTSSFCQGNGDLNVWDFSMPGNDWKRWMWHQVRWWWPWLILASTFNMKISKATIGVGGLLELVGWLQRWWFGKMFRIFPGFLDIHLRCVSFFHTKKHRIGIIRYIYIFTFHIQVEWSRWLWNITFNTHRSEMIVFLFEALRLTAFQRSCMGEWGWDCWKWHWWWWQWPHGIIGARCGWSWMMTLYKTERNWFSMVYYGLLTLWYAMVCYGLYSGILCLKLWTVRMFERNLFAKHHFKSP